MVAVDKQNQMIGRTIGTWNGNGHAQVAMIDLIQPTNYTKAGRTPPDRDNSIW